MDEVAVANLVKYLQFKTVHPNPDYVPAVHWLKSLGEELGLKCNVFELVPDNPILIMCWQGRSPELPAILLNSHMDVVPVVPEKWTHEPFNPTMADTDKIYGRGSQDMKCVGIQQIEAIRRLKARGYTQPRRTIYLCFVPDEEVGGKKGMKPFVAGDAAVNPSTCSLKFEELNIGLCLDEGIPSSTEKYLVFSDERIPCWMKARFEGNAGHGLALIENTAAEKFLKFTARMMQFREQEKTRLSTSGGKLDLGDITTVNLTMVNGGVQYNVVPSTITASYDVRLTPSFSFAKFKEMIDQWAEEAGGQIEFEFIDPGIDLKTKLEPPDHQTSPYWTTLQRICLEHGIGLKECIFPGSTDSRFVRRYHLLKHGSQLAPVECIGFTPIRHTPVLLHDHDEYVPRKEFLEGCCVYTDLVHALAELG